MTERSQTVAVGCVSGAAIDELTLMRRVIDAEVVRNDAIRAPLLSEIERLKDVVRDLVDAIESGDPIPHDSNPMWDRVAIYAKSVAVSAARSVINDR